jgi:hypothetical protein
MRLSAIATSQYYASALLSRAAVYLNGVIVMHVVEVCEEEGWVITASINDRGMTTPHTKSPVGVRCKRWNGDVRIILRSSAERQKPPEVIHPDWLLPPTQEQ